MPDRRRHRGPHPEDRELFGPRRLAELRSAVADLSWLLGKGYAEASARKLVGDRYRLDARQRVGVARCACSDEQRQARAARCVPLAGLRGQRLDVDGFNLLTTIESALAGGLLLRARDGCLRDLASLHGHWKRVDETVRAGAAIGEELAKLEVAHVRWLLDRPVGNSGRLATLLRGLAQARGWSWEVELVQGVDPLLCASSAIVVTADSAVLDRCGAWCNLAPAVVTAAAPGAVIVDLTLWG